MGSCCPPAKSVVIECTVLRVEGETCERCGATVEAVRAAVKDLERMLTPLGVRVTLVEHEASPDETASSNTVMINGRSIDGWLGAEKVETDCPSCAGLLGVESVCCGAVAIGGTVQESYTAEQVREAALTALGLTGEAGCTC